MAEPTSYSVGYDFTAVPGGTNLNIELAGTGDKTVSGAIANTWFCGTAL